MEVSFSTNTIASNESMISNESMEDISVPSSGQCSRKTSYSNTCIDYEKLLNPSTNFKPLPVNSNFGSSLSVDPLTDNCLNVIVKNFNSK